MSATAGTITNVENKYYLLPLKEPLGDSMHGIQTHVVLVTTEITVASGEKGLGYTYTGGPGGMAIWQMLESDFKPALLGRDADCIEAIWRDMYIKLHYVGRGGLIAFALACMDVALWDLKCLRAGLPLWKMIGGGSGQTKAYAGGVDLNFTVEHLLKSVQGYLDNGHKAVKIKVGKDNLWEDVERVAAVREYLGPDIVLMADANYKWTTSEAVAASNALAKFNLLWLEEPVDPDNIRGHRVLAEQGSTAIATGENFRNIYEFEHMFTYGHIDFPQPDVSNIGGITPFLKVAAMAAALQLNVSSHGMHELHVSVLSGLPNPAYLEIHSYPLDQYTTRPMVVTNGIAIPPDATGTGVVFRPELIDPHRVK